MIYRCTVLLSVLILLSSCFSQDRGGTDPSVAVPIVRDILSAAHVSGSLAYWGSCDPHEPYPDFPTIRELPNSSGSPVKLLKEVFAVDDKMQVSQEPNGIIRMSESDVPPDLLDVRIRHLAFGSPSHDSDMFNGPNNALLLILFSPEVKAYRSQHNIGPVAERWVGPGDSAVVKPKVSGDLHDVTVREALDYVLRTFPGFWIYENCRTNGGKAGRNVFFGFFENDTRSIKGTVDAKSK